MALQVEISGYLLDAKGIDVPLQEVLGGRVITRDAKGLLQGGGRTLDLEVKRGHELISRAGGRTVLVGPAQRKAVSLRSGRALRGGSVWSSRWLPITVHL